MGTAPYIYQIFARHEASTVPCVLPHRRMSAIAARLSLSRARARVSALRQLGVAHENHMSHASTLKDSSFSLLDAAGLLAFATGLSCTLIATTTFQPKVCDAHTTPFGPRGGAESKISTSSSHATTKSCVITQLQHVAA